MKKYPVAKTSEEWKAQLTPEQYQVAREHGTERAFTGQYWDCKDQGIYHCVCCGATLFDSGTKYDSGSGWPSFWEPLAPENIGEETDVRHGMRRTFAGGTVVHINAGIAGLVGALMLGKRLGYGTAAMTPHNVPM